MSGRFGRSVFLALYGAFLLSLAAAFAALALNDRFLDSVKDGYIVFLAVPLAATIPGTLIALITGAAAGGDGVRQGKIFLALVCAAAVLPPGIYLIHHSLAAILSGSTGLAGVILAGSALFLLAGAVRVGTLVAAVAAPGGKPRWWFAAVLFVILVLLPPVGSRLSARPVALDGKGLTLFFCMDGAKWDIIDPMVERGELPAFRKLEDEGVRYDLESTGPLMSPILWTTIATGVPSTEHKVNTFYATSSTCASPRIWDMVEENGGTVGILGWPVTWPPRRVNGFLIPSLFARGPETWPEELSFIREIAMREKGKRSRDFGSYLVYGIRSIEYGVRLSTLRAAADVLRGGDDFYMTMSAKRFLKLKMHSDIFIELLERYRPDFAAFYNNSADVTSHYFWKFFEPGSFSDVTPEDAAKYGGTIPEAYRRYDAAMGRIEGCLPSNTNIVVVSDHGLQATETQGGGTIRLILTEKFLDALGLAGTVQGINLASRVYLRPIGNTGTIPGELGELVRDVTIAGTGEPVFDTRTDDFGNLIVEVNRKVDLDGKSLRIPGRSGAVPAADIIEETHAKISGEHSPKAILLIRGERIRRGVKGGTARIMDVAPTALYMMGYPVHSAMKGKILENAFIEGWVRNHPAKSRTYDLADAPPEEAASAGDENLKEVLKSLGYLND